jgi:hypothetical protein
LLGRDPGDELGADEPEDSRRFTKEVLGAEIAVNHAQPVGVNESVAQGIGHCHHPRAPRRG